MLISVNHLCVDQRPACCTVQVVATFNKDCLSVVPCKDSLAQPIVAVAILQCELASCNVTHIVLLPGNGVCFW